MTRYHWRIFEFLEIASTGCFTWNFGISNGRSTKTVHIRLYVGKAKMCLRSSSLFFIVIQLFENPKYQTKHPLVFSKSSLGCILPLLCYSFHTFLVLLSSKTQISRNIIFRGTHLFQRPWKVLKKPKKKKWKESWGINSFTLEYFSPCVTF